MKFIYKILPIAFLTVFLVGCDLESKLDNPNEATPLTADLDLYFNNAQFELSKFLGGVKENFASVNDVTYRVTRMMAMTGGNTYDNAFGPTTFNYMWGKAYAEVLPDLRAIQTISSEGGNLIHLGAAQIMEAYVMMTLVDLFGDVPYSQALQGGDNFNPGADGGADIYASALVLINSAIDNFSNAGAIQGPTNDLFYGGDASKWLKAANSMKLKYYVSTRLVNGDAAAQINGIADNVIKDHADDFQFNYGNSRANPDSRHPDYGEGYENGPNDYQSNYFMWSLQSEKGFSDPRLPYYFYRQDLDTSDEDQFTLDCVAAPRPSHYTGPYPWCVDENGYWGRDHGNNDGIPPDDLKRAVQGIYPCGGKYDAGEGGTVQNAGTDGAGGSGILPFILSSYNDFMLAEAALMLGTNGSARDYLGSGVRKSLEKVSSFASMRGAPEMTPEDMDEYVNFTLGQFDNAANPMEVIGKEYHIALWGNGIEAYNLYRRTGTPVGMQPTREPTSGEFIRTMLYPSDYVGLNLNASQKENTTQVFWDNNPAGFIH